MEESDTSFVESIELSQNRHITELIEYCESKDVDIAFFTAPLYHNNTDFSGFEQSLPNYHSFARSFEDATLFKDYSHLNEEG